MPEEPLQSCTWEAEAGQDQPQPTELIEHVSLILALKSQRFRVCLWIKEHLPDNMHFMWVTSFREQLHSIFVSNPNQMFKPFCDCTIILFYEATQTSFNKIWTPLCIFNLLTKPQKPSPQTRQGEAIGQQSSGENTFAEKTPLPTWTGAEMLPALRLCYCRIINQAGAAEEAEAAHSYLLSIALTWGGRCEEKSLSPQHDTDPNTTRSRCT